MKILTYIFIFFLVGCAGHSSPLSYKFDESTPTFSVVESQFVRISSLNWTKFNLHSVDGKFTELDNVYGLPVPTKISTGKHAIQLKIITLVSQGLKSSAHTARVNLTFDFSAVRYRINGRIDQNVQEIWLETENGLIASPIVTFMYED
jgi:hypothetical protein